MKGGIRCVIWDNFIDAWRLQIGSVDCCVDCRANEAAVAQHIPVAVEHIPVAVEHIPVAEGHTSVAEGHTSAAEGHTSAVGHTSADHMASEHIPVAEEHTSADHRASVAAGHTSAAEGHASVGQTALAWVCTCARRRTCRC